MTDAEERFAKLVEEFAGRPDVEAPQESTRRTFGSFALKVNGSIFAMVTGGRLVLKLRQDRVRALIDSRTGAPFNSGKKSPMKQWVSVVVDDEETWTALASEALDFVRSQSRP